MRQNNLIIIVFQTASFDGLYHGLMIELKVPDEKKGKESEGQIFYRKFLADLGFRTEVFRCWEDAADAIIDHARLPIRKPVRRG